MFLYICSYIYVPIYMFLYICSYIYVPIYMFIICSYIYDMYNIHICLQGVLTRDDLFFFV